MRFGILGPLEAVSDGGVSVKLGGPRQRMVMATLLMNANHLVTFPHLLEAVWYEEPPPSAPVNVRGYISALRRSLDDGEENGDRLQPSKRLTTLTGGYLLRVETSELDLSLFMDRLRQGELAMATGQIEQAARSLQSALGLWRGNPLDGLPVTLSVRAELERIKELRMLAVERAAQARLDLGQADALVPELATLTSRHPFRERLWELLIVALHRTGRQADALAAYSRVRRMLVKELGIDPSDRLKRLEQQILRGNHRLDALATAPAHRDGRAA
ncbi:MULTISPECIES: AfsR/SARP family transcriptional regulator [Streptomyces]|uniref:AfsR/SARP family transcriptional regulator n=1 Tax=Streptomyces TaxID=1883 RepID=UPI0005F01284|nr:MULTISPECIES: AfsR/SARP family transcriptional regulator [unclassified Streptomyces]SFO09090.1 DNA-binding transcriptional activator of the SARP family [Streptomyces sp. cf124]